MKHTIRGASYVEHDEEPFYVLIAIVSEEANATKMPLPALVRREIVYALAMGACLYTDLKKRVVERMAEVVCFERVLGETANFKAPESTSSRTKHTIRSISSTSTTLGTGERGWITC
jgi:E3 ubiquitin-protein ligase UBR1